MYKWFKPTPIQHDLLFRLCPRSEASVIKNTICHPLTLIIAWQVSRETTKIVLKQTKNLQQYADKGFMLNEMLQATPTLIARSLSKQLQARGMLSRYSQLLKASHLSVDSPCSPFHQNNWTSPLALPDKGVFKAKCLRGLNAKGYSPSFKAALFCKGRDVPRCKVAIRKTAGREKHSSKLQTYPCRSEKHTRG